MERRLTDFGAGTVRAGEENSSSVSVLSSCVASGSLFLLDGSGGEEAWARVLGTLGLRVAGGESCRAWAVAAAALALVSWLMAAALVGELVLEIVLRRVARLLRPDCSHESSALRAAWGVRMANSRSGRAGQWEARGVGIGGNSIQYKIIRNAYEGEVASQGRRGMWSGVGGGGGQSTAGATTTRVARRAEPHLTRARATYNI